MSEVEPIPDAWKCQHTPAQVRPLTCDKCTADEVYTLYNRINEAYRKGQPVCTDFQFDSYEIHFRERFPEDRRFWQVGENNPEQEKKRNARTRKGEKS